MAQWIGAYTSPKYLTLEATSHPIRFGLRCITARQRLGLSREEFGEIVNLSPGSIKILEEGRTPKLLKADKLCAQIILALYSDDISKKRTKELKSI